MLLDAWRRVWPFDLRYPNRWHLSVVELRELPEPLPNLPQAVDVPVERPTPLVLTDAYRPEPQLDTVLAVAFPTPERPWPDPFRLLQRRKVVLALPKKDLPPAEPLRMKALPEVLKETVRFYALGDPQQQPT